MPSNMKPRTSFSTPPSLPSFPFSPLSCRGYPCLPMGICPSCWDTRGFGPLLVLNFMSFMSSEHANLREGGGRYRGRGCVGATAVVVAVFNLNLPLPPRMLILALNLLISDCDRDWRTCQFSRAVATHTHQYTHSHTPMHTCAFNDDAAVRSAACYTSARVMALEFTLTNIQALTWSTVQDYSNQLYHI